MIADLLVPLGRHPIPADRRRHHAAVHERDVGERQIQGRERLIQLRDERGDVALRDCCLAGIADAVRFPRAKERPLAPRDEKQIAPGQ